MVFASVRDGTQAFSGPSWSNSGVARLTSQITGAASDAAATGGAPLAPFCRDGDAALLPFCRADPGRQGAVER
jgi:hypothetical protein